MTVDQALLDWFRTAPGEEEAEQAVRPDPGPPALTRAALVAAPPERREQLLGHYLRQEIGRVLHCPAEAVDRDQTMTDLGIGSMTGLELRNRIEAHLGVAPGLTAILRAGNIRELAARLEDVLT